MGLSLTLCHLGFPFKADEVITYAPVGALYLMANLRDAGWEVDFRDYQLNTLPDPFSQGSLCRFLENQCDVVGIGCMTKELPLAVLAAQKLKQARPETFILLGGTGPSPVARELLEAFPWIDCVARGEADETIVEIMRCLERRAELDGVRGITVRVRGMVIETAERPLIENLDALPFPAYSSLDVSRYNTVYLSGSRGCLFRCTFCDQPGFWGKRLRSRSASSIFAELTVLSCLKRAWNITFADNIFCAGPRALEEFLYEYRRTPLRFSFGANQRVGLVTPAVTAILKEMNTKLVLLGIESGSEKVLRRIGKTFTPAQARETIRLCSESVPVTVASFMFNFPFERLEEFLETLSFIRDILVMPTRNSVVLQLHYLAPLAGTPVLEEYRSKLRMSSAASIMTSAANHEEYRTTELAGKKVLVTPLKHPARIAYPEEMRRLVRAYRDIFPSHYLYQSPEQTVKEEVLSLFVDSMTRGSYSFRVPLGKSAVVSDEEGISIREAREA
jgi:radical SAM superfamily enzyme YgiQ (UPF0313 family)